MADPETVPEMGPSGWPFALEALSDWLESHAFDRIDPGDFRAMPAELRRMAAWIASWREPADPLPRWVRQAAWDLRLPTGGFLHVGLGELTPGRIAQAAPSIVCPTCWARDEPAPRQHPIRRTALHRVLSAPVPGWPPARGLIGQCGECHTICWGIPGVAPPS